MKISERILHRILRRLKKNRELGKGSGAPIAAVAFYKKGLILTSRNNIRTVNKQSDPNTHAELLCLNILPKNSKHNGKIRLLVLSKPCPACAKVINKDSRIKEVIYLTDRKRGTKNLPKFKKPIYKYEPETYSISEQKLLDEILEIYNDFIKHNTGRTRPKK